VQTTGIFTFSAIRKIESADFVGLKEPKVNFVVSAYKPKNLHDGITNWFFAFNFVSVLSATFAFVTNLALAHFLIYNGIDRYGAVKLYDTFASRQH